MALKKFLKYLVLTGVFLLPFIPFVVTGSLFFPFITGKNFLFRVIVEVMACAWLVLAIRDVEYRPKKSLLLWAFSAFIVVMLIADAFGVNPMKAFWSNFERMEGFVTLAHLFVYFIVASCILNTQKLWERLFQTSLGAATLVSIYGLIQISGHAVINQGGVRVDATLGNASYLAIYLVFHIFLALFFFTRNLEKKWIATCYGLLTILLSFVLYHTATRGAILGLIAGLGITTLLVAIFEKKNRALKKVAIGAIVLIVAFVGIFFLARKTDFVTKSPVLSRFSSISVTDSSTLARFYVWNTAWQGVKEHPILGWGQEGFNYVFNKYYDPRMYNQEQWFDRTHNVFLDWAIAGGILGLGAYLFLFASAFWCLWKKGEDTFSFLDKSVFSGLLVAYFINNVFVFDNITSYILFAMVLGFLHFHYSKPILSLTKVETEASEKDIAKIFGPSAVVLCILLLYFVNWKGYATASTLIDALRALQNQQPVIGLTFFQKASTYDSFGQPEVRERIIGAVPDLNNSSADISVKQAFKAFAFKELDIQLKNTPDDARYQLFTGMLYGNYGLYDDALKYTKKASELSPLKQTILYQLGSIYINKSNFSEALATFKKAYDLEPNNTEALDYYAISALYNGDQKLAESILIPKYGTIDVPTDKFLQFFIETKQWSHVITIFKTRLATNPNSVSDHSQLAAVYLQSGKRKEAIAEVRKAIELDPSLKEQGEQFIREVEAGRNP